MTDHRRLDDELLLATAAQERWMARRAVRLAITALSPLDVLVMLGVQHRGMAKRAADLAALLCLEDIHLINYSLKKLSRANLVRWRRSGKERQISITAEGQRACVGWFGHPEGPAIARSVLPAQANIAEVTARLRTLAFLLNDQAHGDGLEPPAPTETTVDPSGDT